MGANGLDVQLNQHQQSWLTMTHTSINFSGGYYICFLIVTPGNYLSRVLSSEDV